MIVPQEIYHPLYEDKEKFIILIPEMMEKIDLDGTTKYFRFSLV